MESPFEPPTSEAFRRACGRFATGVAIVTTVNPDATPCGLTVNSFSSVSLTPPLVLFCLDRTAHSLPAFLASKHFVINILDQSQRHLSQRFAGRQEGRFDGVDYRLGHAGSPVLAGALAVLECRLRQALEGGDHLIFLGEVIALEARDGDPLLYFSGSYRHLAE